MYKLHGSYDPFGVSSIPVDMIINLHISYAGLVRHPCKLDLSSDRQ